MREPRRPLDPGDFPGCTAVELPADEVDDYEGRIEYWEASTSTAMVIAEGATAYHELPSRRLGELVREIAMARGSEILALGSTSLVRYDDDGVREFLMQADESYFLDRPRLLGKEIDIDVGPLPDLILEVDHTTDVRRGKLETYASWGLPEVWVDVPEPDGLAPRESRRPQLTIYLLKGDVYMESAVSRAFAGWTAVEIHRGLNEATKSAATVAALRRVGRRLGRAAGTRPDDDRFLRAEREESRAEGWAEGRAEGERGMARTLVRQAIQARDLTVTPEAEAWLERLSATTDAAAVFKAVVECRDGADLVRRLKALAADPEASK